MKRKIIITTLVLMVAGGIIGYRLYSKQTPDVVNDKPDASLTTRQLVEQFEKDTATAINQFINKTVEITGRIKTIDTSGAIVLGDEGSASEVVVGFDRRHLKDIEKIKTGETVTLQGVCTGYDKSSNADDLLASLGATVQLRSAGLKQKKSN